ncbi:hypothetical protein RRG08_064398 [Elysia crispata]|uniref:HTH CENPB-type domain-containing protein n=1 Tax=Elysia crispata TaxID=231223 RepID=A0AAE1ARR5_9GAST|nr:hypothetical protein RRG08_064398 [Elysia crispata]
MKDAFNAVMGKKMSTYAAAKHLGVGHKALWFITTGKIPINAHQGRSPDLGHSEQEMVDCILLMADWGWGFSAEEVRDVVQDFVKTNKIETQFAEGRPGEDWLWGFLQRHRKISRRTTEHLSRGGKEDPEIIQHWFQPLLEQLEKSGVKDMPDQIYNTDKTGFETDPKLDCMRHL